MAGRNGRTEPGLAVDTGVAVALLLTLVLAACGGRSRSVKPGGGESGGVGGELSSSPGGTSGGGAGGAAGQGVAGSSLAGDYDVLFGAPPELEGCTPRFELSRLNLQVDPSDGVLARPFRDFGYDFVEPAAPHLDEMTFVTDAVEGAPPFDGWVPALALPVGPSGFAHYGQATLEYDCAGGSEARAMDVIVVPDSTPPELRAQSTLPTGRDLFPFSSLALAFSEPVTSAFGAYDDELVEPADAAASVGLVEVATQEEIPTTWYTALSGAVAEARFTDLEGLAGRSVAPRPLSPLADRAGNPAVADLGTFFVHEAAELGFALTFDEEPRGGVMGAATWFAPGAAESPCEAGGCVAFDGAGYGCSADFTESPAYLAVSLGESPPRRLRIRYRILYVDETDAPVHLFQHYPSGCVGYSQDLPRAPLPVPLDGYGYATPWLEAKVSPCDGPIVERGMLFELGCEAASEPRPRARLVIQRIERADTI